MPFKAPRTTPDALPRADLTWRTPDESVVIPVDPAAPIDTTLFDRYDICMTGAALKQYADRRESWHQLVQRTWVYARVSPAQKEFILTTLKSLGYVTLMAGDGTNDVGALKQANIGVALLNGSEDDLKAIAEHQKKERIKKVYEQQLRITSRFGQPPPPVPPQIADLFPDAVKAQQAAAKNVLGDRKEGKVTKVCCALTVFPSRELLNPLCLAVRHFEHLGPAVEHGRRKRGAADQAR